MIDELVKTRFWSKVEITDNCWIWKGGKVPDGYGCFWNSEKNVGAHRFSYQIFYGEIPKDLVINHKCRNRCCVNPYHLELTTNKQNILLGIGITAVNKNKEYCKRGHKLDEENIYAMRKNRDCKICANLRAREYFLNNRERYLSYQRKYYHKRRELCLLQS